MGSSGERAEIGRLGAPGATAVEGIGPVAAAASCTDLFCADQPRRTCAHALCILRNQQVASGAGGAGSRRPGAAAAATAAAAEKAMLQRACR